MLTSKRSTPFDLDLARRFYLADHKTLQQVGELLGVSRQAVHDRFRRAGIARRPRPPLPKTQKRIFLERDQLYELYVTKALKPWEIGALLGTSYSTVRNELKRHNIPLRKRGYDKWKYKFLEDLKRLESVVFPRPQIKHPHLTLYRTARLLGIKIAVKSINKFEIMVTRID